MLLLFVGGVMHLAWIAVLSVVVLAEKYAPVAWRADRVLAGIMLAAAVVILVRRP
jgi:predicted metal-binding membrane protein